MQSAGGTIPEDFEVDVTDQDLLAACSTSLPGRCKTRLATETKCGTSLVVATPLVALLFATIAKLFA